MAEIRENAQLFSDAVQASNTGQGVARKAIHSCWKRFSIFFLPSDKPVFSAPITAVIFLKSHFSARRPLIYLKTDTCPSIPHQGPGHTLAVFCLCHSAILHLCLFAFARI